MRFIRRIFFIFLTSAILFFGLNFNWTHAALAWMVTKENCPATLITLAKKDVAVLFGSISASPLWVCSKKPLLGLDVSHGTTRSMPFFPSVIVIGKKGPQRNVMAHEYAHAELATRIKMPVLLVPTWFDEGLAMQVDHRRAYSRKALKRYLRRKGTQPPRLDELGSPYRFYKRNKARLNYAFATCVVGQWLKREGRSQLTDLLKQISWRSSFPVDQFRADEQRCLKR